MVEGNGTSAIDNARIVRVGALARDSLDIDFDNGNILILSIDLILSLPGFKALSLDDRIYYPKTDGRSIYWRDGPRPLADHGLTPGHIWDKEIGSLELEMRWQKEQYYSEDVEKAYILEPFLLDDNGDPIEKGQDRRGEKVYERRTLSYRVDDDFLERAVHREKIQIECGAKDMGINSWYGHLETFLWICEPCCQSRDCRISPSS